MNDNTTSNLNRSQLGPVTAAIRAMRAADPDRLELRELRTALLRRLAADLSALDRLEAIAGRLTHR